MWTINPLEHSSLHSSLFTGRGWLYRKPSSDYPKDHYKDNHRSFLLAVLRRTRVNEMKEPRCWSFYKKKERISVISTFLILQLYISYNHPAQCHSTPWYMSTSLIKDPTETVWKQSGCSFLVNKPLNEKPEKGRSDYNEWLLFFHLILPLNP